MKQIKRTAKLILAFGLMIVITMSCGSSGGQKVVIETDFGNMTLELYDSTPKHRDNFIKLVNEAYYDDLLFHRVMSGFMIQGGDPQSRGAAAGQRLGMGGPGYLIDQEIGAPHLRGALAAAMSPNPAKSSSGSQFYVVQGQIQSDASLNNWESRHNIKYNETQREKYKTIGGRPDLDMGYTVFGEVVDGIEVVDKIAAVQVDGANRPLQDVKMKIRLAN